MGAERAQPAIEPFNRKYHSRSGFTCEVESLGRYFKTQAGQDVKTGTAAVFVLAEHADVLGYYTLSSYAIEPGELPPDLARRFPSYPKLPAILIGRLARDQKWKGQGIGEILLVDALRRCLENTATVGAIAVVVEAHDEKARNFYLGYGFVQFPDHENKLFIPMNTIRKALSAQR